MKKKSFFCGYNARLALAVVTLSGALLTGCYKDSDLDATTPGGSVTIPAATYTLTGTVINAEGAMVEDATITVTPNTKLEVSGASFTAAVAPGDVTIKVTPKAGSAYKEVSKTVKVIAVSAGQAAVYTETIVLTKDAQAEKVDAKYDVDVLVFGASDLNAALPDDAYTLKVTNGAGTEVSSLTGLTAGMYNVVVTPKDPAKYNAYTAAISLAALKVEAGSTNIPVKIYSVLTEKAAQTEYRVLSAYVDYEEKSEIDFKNIKITRTIGSTTETLASTTANYIVYLDEVVADATYKIIVAYDVEGIHKEVSRTITSKNTAFVIVLRESSISTELDGEEKEIVIDKETGLYLPKGLTAKLNNVDYTGDIDLGRLFNEEFNFGVLRAFEGTPDGLEFDKPIEISFIDNWNGQLGNLSLKYYNKETGNWNVDTKGGYVGKEGDSYVMYVNHFSMFKAEVAADVTTAVEYKTESKETLVNKKNDTESAVFFGFEYTYKRGMTVSNVEDAIVKAGFTGVAIPYLTNFIRNTLSQNGFYDEGIWSERGYFNITVAPWTCLESVVKKQDMRFTTLNFTINEKVVSIVIQQPAAHIIIPNTYTFGHGHGHSHGHGDLNNAGGGIVEAE